MCVAVADDMIEKADIWRHALAPSSPFFDSAVLSKFSAPTCEILASLCQQLLLLHVVRVDSTPGPNPSLSSVVSSRRVHAQDVSNSSLESWSSSVSMEAHPCEGHRLLPFCVVSDHRPPSCSTSWMPFSIGCSTCQISRFLLSASFPAVTS